MLLSRVFVSRKVPRHRLKVVVSALLTIVSPTLSLAQAPSPSFSEYEARHLLNRAGLGGSLREFSDLVSVEKRVALAQLFEGRGKRLRPFDHKVLLPPQENQLKGLSREKREKFLADSQQANHEQTIAYQSWWMDRMVQTDRPLIERMTLFWHGYFTSSVAQIRHSTLMIDQINLLRRHAVGNFRDMLHEVSRNPAMLLYLNNNENRKGRPNENFAREVMELFTLGVGKFSEVDVKNAARAFTGWTVQGNRFLFEPQHHDYGKKQVLGRLGHINGSDVLDILLAHPEAPRHVASRILRFFLGRDPPSDMLNRYAGWLLRDSWEIRPFLERLLLDPQFYNPDIVGSRILGPVEFVVGIGRRLEGSTSGSLLAWSADTLGQSLLHPPGVQGWVEGDAWITTSTFLVRGRIAAYLVEGTSRQEIYRDLVGQSSPMTRGVRLPLGGPWQPSSPLREQRDIAEAESLSHLIEVLCRRFLAVEVTEEARESLEIFARGNQPDESSFRLPDESFIRRVVALILRLPEAQLG